MAIYDTVSDLDIVSSHMNDTPCKPVCTYSQLLVTYSFSLARNLLSTFDVCLLDLIHALIAVYRNFHEFK